MSACCLLVSELHGRLCGQIKLALMRDGPLSMSGGPQIKHVSISAKLAKKVFSFVPYTTD